MSKKQTILITGASGFIGGHLIQLATRLGYSVYGTKNTTDAIEQEDAQVVSLDITNAVSAQKVIEKIKPQVIIHAAAISNAEYCFKNPQEAYSVNVSGTKNIAQIAQKIGAHLIYVSTDLVFDGMKGNYNEEDIPTPTTVYGKTKFEGEKIVHEVNENFTITRLSWVYGKSANHAANFLEKMLCALKQNENIKLFFDEYRSPVFVVDACNALLALSQSKSKGIFHIAGPERMSRLDFGLIAAEIFKIDNSLIIPSSSDFVNLSEKRPKDCSLINLNKILPIMEFKPVEEVLVELSKVY